MSLLLGLGAAIALLGGGASATLEVPTARVAATESTLYVSAGGSDRSSCTQTAPCASFDRAYHAAKPGDRVVVLAGSYGDQSLGADASKLAPSVVIEPAPGVSVSLTSLVVEGASYLTLRNLSVPVWTVQNKNPGQPGSHDVTLEGVRAQSGYIVGQVVRVSVLGGSLGNVINEDGMQIKKFSPFEDPDGTEPSDILIDGVRIGNIRSTDPSQHTDGIQILNGNRITVRDSVFWNIEGTGGLDITPLSVVSNVTFENNFLGGPGFGSQIGGMVRNLVYRNNSADTSVAFADQDVVGPYLFAGNYMPYNFSLCETNPGKRATFSHNVLAGGVCGSTDVNVPRLEFVDPAAKTSTSRQTRRRSAREIRPTCRLATSTATCGRDVCRRTQAQTSTRRHWSSSLARSVRFVSETRRRRLPECTGGRWRSLRKREFDS